MHGQTSFVKVLEGHGVTVKKGIFGADMKIEQYNDGPVTILLQSERGE